MDSRTFKLRVTISAITAVMGLTACNETGFSLSTQGQAELDKLNPIQPPVPPAGNPPANPPSDPAPVPSSTQAPAPVPTAPAPVPKPTVPAPVPTETAPAPTPTAPPAPKPTVPVPTPTAPAPVPTPTAPAPKPTVPAPVPTPTAPAPVPTSTAPAPVPTQPAPVPSPVPTVVPTATPTAKIGDGLNEFNPPKVETRPMVDILFVVDNSSSMQDNQNVLAQSFGSFIKAFREKDVDARFGIITTDTTPASVKTKSGKPYWEDGKLNGYYRPGPGNLLSKFSNPVWVSHDDKDLIGHFTANVRVGTSGSGSEMSIQSLELALADSKISKGGFNEGFIRDEAMLSLVIVSDEDNNITEKGVTPDALIDRLRTRLAAVKGSKSRGYSCDLVIDMSAKAPKGPITYPLANTMNSYPNVYLKAADKMGCRKLDIAKNWGSDLAKIGYQIVSQAEKEFKLSAKPIDGSIVVKIDGKVIAADAKNGYVYHADRNTIELMGDALASSAGAKVTVEYKYNQ